MPTWAFKVPNSHHKPTPTATPPITPSRSILLEGDGLISATALTRHWKWPWCYIDWCLIVFWSAEWDVVNGVYFGSPTHYPEPLLGTFTSHPMLHQEPQLGERSTVCLPISNESLHRLCIFTLVLFKKPNWEQPPVKLPNLAWGICWYMWYNVLCLIMTMNTINYTVPE